MTNDNYNHCPNCNWSATQVRERKKPGCPTCFIFHASLLREFFIPNQNSLLHHQSDKSLLYDSIALALEEENYELAAQLRDQLETL